MLLVTFAVVHIIVSAEFLIARSVAVKQRHHSYCVSSSMLETDMSKRPSVDECLGHGFFQLQTGRISSIFSNSSKPLPLYTTNNLLGITI